MLATYEHKTSKNLHELQKKFFQASIQPRQTMTEYIASLDMILSELATLGDKTFTDNVMISKLTSTLPEGFDHFNTAWESTPSPEQTLANFKLRILKEEAKIKKRITSDITFDTKAFFTQRQPMNSGSYTGRTFARGGFPGLGSTRPGQRDYQPTSRGYHVQSRDKLSPQTFFGDR
jgi:hypothetical protein